MLVEFIGSTGAGKTSVIGRVLRRLAPVADATTATELVTGVVGLGRVRHPTVQNLIQEIVGLPFFLSSAYRHRAFVGCAMRLLGRDAKAGVAAISNVRSLERKLGVYTLLRRMSAGRIILVDEGPVLAAHMFVPAAERLAPQDIDRFAKTVPLPDLIVHVRAPVDVILRRTANRPDPPRDMCSRGCTDRTRYAEAAAALFERVVASLRHRVPVLVVDNAHKQDQEVLVNTVSSFITRQWLQVVRSPGAALARRHGLGVGERSYRCSGTSPY